jgi:serine protease Do
MRCSLTVLILGSLTVAGRSADPPVAALQDQIRKLIDGAAPSVVALVISHNPNYPHMPIAAERSRGKLGEYTPPLVDRFGVKERNPLDLSDAKNIPDNNYGTGVVLDTAGLILTNYHLIENATKVYIRFPGGGGSYADIVAADARSDLAVLRSIGRPAGLSAVRIADVRVADESGGRQANVFRGMWVVSLAHPFGAGFADGEPSASWGILSNVRRRAPGYGNEDPRANQLYNYGSLLQTDARLNLGCSGGALINLEGELIGLTSSVAAVTGSEAAGGYAIPMTANFRRIIEALKAGREVEYGFLGVAPGRISTVPNLPGLLIESVSPHTPAQAAGLQASQQLEDIVQEINGVPVREADDLYFNIGSSTAGTKVRLKIARRERLSGEYTTFEATATLAKYKNSLPSIVSVRPKSVHGLRVDYSSLLAQPTPAFRAGPIPAHKGVIVRDLEPNSPAEAAFKKLGGIDPTQWMITAVNGESVATPDEFYRAAGKGGPVRLTVASPSDTRDSGRVVTLP